MAAYKGLILMPLHYSKLYKRKYLVILNKQYLLNEDQVIGAAEVCVPWYFILKRAYCKAPGLRTNKLALLVAW